MILWDLHILQEHIMTYCSSQMELLIMATWEEICLIMYRPLISMADFLREPIGLLLRCDTVSQRIEEVSPLDWMLIKTVLLLCIKINSVVVQVQPLLPV